MLKQLFRIKNYLFALSLITFSLSVYYLVGYYSNTERLYFTNNMQFGTYELGGIQEELKVLEENYPLLEDSFKQGSKQVYDTLLTLLGDDAKNYYRSEGAYDGTLMEGQLIYLPKGGDMHVAYEYSNEGDDFAYTLLNLNSGSSNSFDQDFEITTKKDLAPGVYYLYPKAGKYLEGHIQFRYEITLK